MGPRMKLFHSRSRVFTSQTPSIICRKTLSSRALVESLARSNEGIVPNILEVLHHWQRMRMCKSTTWTWPFRLFVF